MLSCTMGPFVNLKLFNIFLAVIPVIFLISFGLLAPETPTYLMKQGDENLARAALEKLRTNKNAIERDISELQSADKEQETNVWSELFK